MERTRHTTRVGNNKINVSMPVNRNKKGKGQRKYKKIKRDVEHQPMNIHSNESSSATIDHSSTSITSVFDQSVRTDQYQQKRTKLGENWSKTISQLAAIFTDVFVDGEPRLDTTTPSVGNNNGMSCSCDAKNEEVEVLCVFLCSKAKTLC